MALHPTPALGDTFRAYGITFAYLFGSRALDEHRPGSDPDVAVMPTRALQLGDLGQLASAIARSLGVPEVDLVEPDRAKLELRGEVVQQGSLLFSDDETARVAFEVRTRSEYFDYPPTLRAHTKRFLEQVRARGLQGLG